MPNFLIFIWSPRVLLISYLVFNQHILAFVIPVCKHSLGLCGMALDCVAWRPALRHLRVWSWIALRIQICSKKGISAIILFRGWDWDQSYSRNGFGFLGWMNLRNVLTPHLVSNSNHNKKMQTPKVIGNNFIDTNTYIGPSLCVFWAMNNLPKNCGCEFCALDPSNWNIWPKRSVCVGGPWGMKY